MDDLDLEARLRTHLHRRFDDAPLPSGLVPDVGQALATATRPVGPATRTGRLRLGWAAVAAAAVIAVSAVAIGKGLVLTGPGAAATPTPQATTAPERDFIVLPPVGSLDKPEASLATEVLSARIRALGIGTFSSGGGYGIEFMLPPDGPSDASIRAVLGATGDVRVVPLPAAEYGAGKLTATLGVPLPKDEPTLFGWEGIASFASVAFTTADGAAGAPLIAMTPKPPAAQAFADYVAMNPGETYAIVVDGKVALLPRAQPAVADGSINLSNGQLPGGSEPTAAYYETAAILVGGMLPEAWRGASVPVIVSRDQAIAAALVATRGGTVQDASPTVDEGPLLGSLRAVWYVDVYQPDCPDTQSCISSYLRVRVDAVTGTVIDMAPQGSSAAP